MSQRIVDASIDPLGIGPVTGAKIAAKFAAEPYDPLWSQRIWDDVGYAPATIFFHYGSIDMLPWYDVTRRKAEGTY